MASRSRMPKPGAAHRRCCWCTAGAGDHTHLASQFDYFGRTDRVVAVDLRGHGASDKPVQEYTVAGFADDLAWFVRPAPRR
jgi:pimeloyl-ACP methyl ester carboxylesterase